MALVVLLACALGLLTGMVFAALDSGFTSIGGHDAPLVEQSNALYYAVSDMDAQVAPVEPERARRESTSSELNFDYICLLCDHPSDAALSGE